ncbi:hypothetical protein N7453_002364 [Penicillium expansum]|nr:hypothetical protein N7453_002364 [Penicillium expansum]
MHTSEWKPMLLSLNPKDALDTGVMDTGDWRGMFALYAQECAERLELAIQDMERERVTVANKPPRTTFQPYTMTKEAFIFSDDAEALRRLRGDVAYDPHDGVGSQMDAISQHSKTLHRLGVHV